MSSGELCFSSVHSSCAFAFAIVVVVHIEPTKIEVVSKQTHKRVGHAQVILVPVVTSQLAHNSFCVSVRCQFKRVLVCIRGRVIFVNFVKKFAPQASHPSGARQSRDLIGASLCNAA